MPPELIAGIAGVVVINIAPLFKKAKGSTGYRVGVIVGMLSALIFI